ncbi:MAG: hypothetical protein IKU23_07820 [Clostridia bacterium]|nr:hypothetical protein [Clostridia bacterium]
MDKKCKLNKKLEDELNKLVPMLEGRYKRWHEIRTDGCFDPYYTDGSNMNLVRNHILNYRSRIKTICETLGVDLPKVCTWDVPIEVSKDYMANPDQIRQIAKETLPMLESNADYIALKPFGRLLTAKQREHICYDGVMGYVRRLKMALERDDLVDMRLYIRNPERYAKAFATCLKNANALDIGQVQVSLFDLIND